MDYYNHKHPIYKYITYFNSKLYIIKNINIQYVEIKLYIVINNLKNIFIQIYSLQIIEYNI